MAIDKYEAPQGMIAIINDEKCICTKCYYRNRACPSVACTTNCRADKEDVYFIKAPTTDIFGLCISECLRIAAEAIEERGELEEARGATLCADALLKLKSTKEV